MAGDVLTYIPYALPPAPSFNDVAYWFAKRSEELYGPTVAAAANHAFRAQVGIGVMTPARHGLHGAVRSVDAVAGGVRDEESDAAGMPDAVAAYRPELDPTVRAA